MTEFETGFGLDVTVNPSSLRSARQTIEDEIGEVQVDVSTSGGASGGGSSRIAGRERAMSRQLLSSQDESLTSIDDAWTDNIDLNEERNDLLRQLLNQSEKDAQTSRGGGMSGMAMGGVGLALGVGAIASSIGANIVSWLGDAMPDLGPGDVVDPVTIGVGDLIDAAASISAADVIDTAATIGAGALVASAAAVTAPALIASKAAISAGNVIGTAATVTASSVVSAAASVTAADLVAAGATVSAAALISTGATVGAAALVEAPAAIAASDLVSGKITASALMDHLTDGENSGETGSTETTGVSVTDTKMTEVDPSTLEVADPENQVDPNEFHTPLQDASLENTEATGTTVDLTAGAHTKSTGPDGTGTGATDWAALGKTGLAAGSLLAAGGLAAADGPLPFGDAAGAGVAAKGGGAALLGSIFAGSAAGQEQSGSTSSGSGNQSTNSSATVNQENRVEVTADLSDLEREVTSQIRDLEKQVNDLKRSLQRS